MFQPNFILNHFPEFQDKISKLTNKSLDLNLETYVLKKPQLLLLMIYLFIFEAVTRFFIFFIFLMRRLDSR